MLRKVILVLLILPIIAGCTTFNADSSYEEVVKAAYDSKLDKSNTHGISYTYNIPKNGTLVSSTTYFDTVKVENQTYNLNVNVAQYLIDKNLLTRTESGDYELFDENKAYVNYIYDTSRILIVDLENLTVEENLARAQNILDELNATGDVVGNFATFAQTYSSDTETALNGGYVGQQSASDISTESLRAIYLLQPGEITSLVSTPNGQQIILLNSVVESDTEVSDETKEFYIDEENLEYSYYDKASDSTVRIIKNNVKFYSIIVSNVYSVVESTVTTEFLNDAIFNSIVLQRSVKINDDIALSYILNPNISTDKTEIINLNNSNTQLENVISTKYQYQFTSSFDDNFTDTSGFNNTNIFTFNSRKMTNDEYNAYIESKLNEETN